MKAKCKRNNRQSGGGLGGGWGYVNPSNLSSTINNPIVADNIGNCRAVTPATLRPGYIPGGYESLRSGLPGMRGGRRRTQRKNRSERNRKNRKVQSGGRYGFVDASLAASTGGTPYTSGIAPMSAIPCEASRSQIPPSGASGVLNLPVGISPLGGQKGGGSADTVGEVVPTARYSIDVGRPFTTAAGTLVAPQTTIPSLSVNMPNYANPACLKTGGVTTGGGRKSRKQRKNRSNRKQKKGTRKNRTQRKH